MIPTLTKWAVLRSIRDALAGGDSPAAAELVAGSARLPLDTRRHIRALRREGLLPQPVRVPDVRVRHFGEVPCGPPAALEDDPSFEWMELAAHITEDLYSLTARGRSMEKAGILDGDRLFFRPADGELPDGQAVVAVVEGSATCKILKRRGEEWWLLPRGYLAEPILLDPDRDDVFILGVLVGTWRAVG